MSFSSFINPLSCLALAISLAGNLNATDYQVAQVGKKNRIVFDVVEQPSPAANASPSPSPNPKDAVLPAVTPTPVAVPKATPIPEPTAPSSAAPVAPAPWPAPSYPSAAPAAQTPVEPSPVPVASVTPEPSPAPVASVKLTPAPTQKPKVTTAQPVSAQSAPASQPPEGVLPSSPVKSEDVVSSAPDLAPHDNTAKPPAPSESVTINLINKLVQRGILTKEDAKEMIIQAQAEADAARAQAQADMFAVAQIAAVRAATEQIAVAQAQNAPASTDDVRVTYVPEPVKTQLKEEIKLELIGERASNKWAGNVFLPKWVDKVKPFFDFRLRYEGDQFPGGNDATGSFPNFNAINTGLPYDVTGTQFAPQLNADQNRNQFRIRVRFGADINLGENFTSGFRVATGQSNSPVSTNQSLGYAGQTGQGGNFSKYAIWLDRAFLRYDLPIDNKPLITAWAGRFDNPFMSTRLIWDESVGFDGAALKLQYEVLPGLVPFVTGGAFVVYNTDLNFSSNQPTKFKSNDKYLYAIQGGLEWKPTADWNLKIAAAYYYFQNIEGKLSAPYTPQNINDASNTDGSRPAFAQKGNTYMAIRDIVPDASNNYGAINQWQYYGLATPFHEVSVTGRLDYNGFEPAQFSLIGEFVQNVAFNKSAIDLIAVNNRGPVADPTQLNAIGPFVGDPTAWLIELRVGTPALAKRWDWSVDVGYRWIGSDAVVDGFNDSNFGLGGTNMKGFTVGGSLALSENVYVSLRWMGADSIAGPTYKTNIIQFDLNSKF